jgi:ribosomal protein S18 acetylase RimI-like enzyme
MVTVRPAREDDGPALQRIDAATFTAEVSPGAPPAPDGPFFTAGTRPADVLVAVQDGEVVGYVKVVPKYPELATAGHVQEVQGLAVAAERQGRGAGRALVEAAIGLARERGARRLTLRALAPNAGALRLYERCGFAVEGVLREEFLIAGRYVDDVLLAAGPDRLSA